MATPLGVSLTESAMSTLAFLLRFLAVGLFVTLPLGAVAAETVGTVTKVENQVGIGGATAVVGTPVHF